MTQTDKAETPVQYILQLLDHKGSVLSETLHDDDLEAHRWKDNSHHPWGSYIFRANRKRNKNGRLPPLPNWRVYQPITGYDLNVSVQAQRVADFYLAKHSDRTGHIRIEVPAWPTGNSRIHENANAACSALKHALDVGGIDCTFTTVNPDDWLTPPVAESAAA